MITTPRTLVIECSSRALYGRKYHVIFSHFITRGKKDYVLEMCDWGIAMLKKEKARRNAGLARGEK